METRNQMPVWKAAVFAFLYLLLFTGIQFVVSLAVSMLILFRLVTAEGMVLFENAQYFGEVYYGAVQEQTSGIVLLSNVLSIFIAWLIFVCRKKKLAREIGLVKTSWQNMVGAVLLGMGLAFTVDFVVSLLPFPEVVMESFLERHNTLWEGSALVSFLSVALLGPVAEEVFFRGLIYNELKKAMRPLIAGGISAAVFGMVHGAAVWMLVGFLAGVALAWIYERTGSLWASILVHITNNTLAQLTTYFPTESAVVYDTLVAVSALILVFAVWFLCRNNPRPSAVQDN